MKATPLLAIALAGLTGAALGAAGCAPESDAPVDPAARGPNPASEDYALVFGVRLQMDF